MQPVTLMIARYPFARQEDPDVTDWYADTLITASKDARIGKVMRYRVDNTPITMGRNRTLRLAIEKGADFLVMVDSDMSPDAYLETNPYKQAVHLDAKPFFQSSFDFMWEQRKKGQPCCIAAPYCGPPPHENVYVFHWEAKASDVPEDENNNSLEQFTRHEASQKSGISRVAALPTGLFMLDVQALDVIDPPYTYYEWGGEQEDSKSSTEDVTFTRDLSLAGVPLYCNWDAWAGHWKRKCVGRPLCVTDQMVSEKFTRAALRKYNVERGEQLVVVGGTNGKEAEGGGRTSADGRGDAQPAAENGASRTRHHPVEA